MFRKLKSSFGGASKQRVKLRYDINVVSLEGLEGVESARIVWARQAKVQVTQLALVRNGVASWNEELCQIASLHRDAKGFEPKEYLFKLQCPTRGNVQKMNTLSKATVDMSRFAEGADGSEKAVEIWLGLPRGQRAKLRLRVSATQVRNVGAEDEEDELESAVSEDSGIS
ncbi:hypothetical protein H632_c2610p0, partial [Helicosporidium sp. ATCC 50920]